MGDTIELIKRCIEETIRKTLPLKHVLEIYLGDDMIEPVPDDNFEKTITEVDEKNLSLLLKKELEPSFISHNATDQKQLEFIKPQEQTQQQTQQPLGSDTNNSIRKSYRSSSSSTRRTGESFNLSQKGGNKSSSDKGINSKILSILND